MSFRLLALAILLMLPLASEAGAQALKPFKDVSPTDADTFSAFTDLSRMYLRITAECRETLLADLKAQREFEELKRRSRPA